MRTIDEIKADIEKAEQCDKIRLQSKRVCLKAPCINCELDTVSKLRLNEELLKAYQRAEREGRLPVLPCKVGDTVWVDVRTLPWNYLHPCDGAKDFAECEVIGFAKTKQDTFMKMKALYPSRMGRRGYLRYGVGAIGKTVFLTREEAEKALKGDTK